MGFEKKTLSLEEIQAGLDAGTIERGDKGDVRVEAADGTEIIHYPEYHSIRFNFAGLTAEVNLTSKLTRLTEPDTGKIVFDQRLSEQAMQRAQVWDEEGLFT